jgi:hypothetical protein
MYELKKIIGKVFTSKFVRTGPSSYEKTIYPAAVSQTLRNTGVGEAGLMCGWRFTQTILLVGRNFFFCEASRPGPEPTHPHLKVGTGTP